MDISLQHFVHDHLHLNTIIREHQDLGAHTNVVVFEPGQVTTFMWTHPTVRPMGNEISKQYQQCYRLRTFRITDIEDHSKTILKCTWCKHAITYAVPIGWEWLHDPPVKGDDRGRWLINIES